MSLPAPNAPTGRRLWLGLVLSLVLAYGVAGLSGSVTVAAIPGWYGTIAKPWFTPPDWVFGPVWTTLYTMMAVAAWRVWRIGPSPRVRQALRLYAIQLALNGLWPLLFFGLHRTDWALAEILVFAPMIALTLWAFWRIDRVSGALMVPYLAWASFATVLNATIVAMN
jgi:tryptophan-rich sensory protein